MNKNKKDITLQGDESISRRQALSKMGYAAFASGTMLLLLNNPTRAQGNSENPGGIGDDPFGDNGNKSFDTQSQKPEDPWKHDEDPWK